MIEELREAIESGNFRINEDGSGTLRGVSSAPQPPSQQNASPLVAAAIKLPDLEPPPQKPRTPSPLIEAKPTPPKTQQPPQKFESDEEEESEEEEEEESEEEQVFKEKNFCN